MAPPPLPLFSPSPKPPPPPPWLHGPGPQNHNPPNPAEAAPPKPNRQGPKQPPPRHAGPPAKAKPLTAGVPGGRNRRAVLGIIRRVRSLELSDPPSPVVPKHNADAPPVAFHLPLETPSIGEDQEDWEERPKPRAVPWAAARSEDIKAALRREKKPQEPTRAERELADGELERLRRVARGMDRWVRAKKAGVTDEVVEEVRGEWDRGRELAAVRLVEPLRRCMDRAREILECPPGVRPTLADEELTYLRKLARPLPTHFALGRNTKVQGLAAAILKLWEKSLIAKIAVKVGVQNTNHQQMAWNLKARGTVILRNKDFIILYRGKDFLPSGVAQTVIEQEAQVYDKQVKEEEARLKAVDSLKMVDEFSSEESSAGTFREYQDFHANLAPEKAENEETLIELEAEKYRLEKELKDQEWKLSTLYKKIERSNQMLAKLHSSWSPSGQSTDTELLTEEEKVIFRKIGLKMDECVLLGRRGVFSGVIEEIHQNWKHKEVVKVITKQNQTRQIMYTAKLLEVETGGILIAVEKLTTSHAIIVYRGKNYCRPTKSSPSNLLTKREALRRSVRFRDEG
ncbi:hypothetical protein PR202_ga20742 [Eleusine coracana subsp. coracana]|uniref:CRM domain-containing protein n=1 Tax=Eleusine coracana subsp. coracana TaxID=191504 RepID=A0AAV5CZE6_ELECO|nr:hypothetical protein PR202_ga20742 [Eleusine coracana subsp. coracana]